MKDQSFKESVYNPEFSMTPPIPLNSKYGDTGSIFNFKESGMADSFKQQGISINDYKKVGTIQFKDSYGKVKGNLVKHSVDGRNSPQILSPNKTVTPQMAS